MFWALLTFSLQSPSGFPEASWVSNTPKFGVFFPDGSVGKESACNAGDTGDANLIPGSSRYTGGGNDNSLQYSCLENPMDRGVWPKGNQSWIFIGRTDAEVEAPIL